MPERQVTNAPHGHLLTNAGVWSPDSRWLVYDVRSDPAGSRFDGARVERVDVATGRVEILYVARNGACCGVATVNPVDGRAAFILGPENPAGAWTYGPDRRHGVLVDPTRPGHAENLDARDLAPPFTPGALRGGTHVHQFDARGEWASFTYDDHPLSQPAEGQVRERAVRMVAAAMPGRVAVPRSHPRNHDGAFFSAVATHVVDVPRPGSDEIDRAYEEAWIAGTRSLAFLGDTRDADGHSVAELFVAELPENLAVPGPTGPLPGTPTTRPRPPRGCAQRRLTHTADRRLPGMAGPGLPRFWPRSSPDGGRIAFLLRDDAGQAQLWTIRPDGTDLRQLTRDPEPVASAFAWTPDGGAIAHVRGGAVFLADADSGVLRRLTACGDEPPRPEACVASPDGNLIAYVRPVRAAGGTHNQLFVCAAR